MPLTQTNKLRAEANIYTIKGSSVIHALLKRPSTSVESVVSNAQYSVLMILEQCSDMLKYVPFVSGPIQMSFQVAKDSS